MIKEFPNFLTEVECQLVIGLGESDTLRQGRIGTAESGSYASKYRKAKVTWMSLEHDLIKRIRSQVAELSGVPIENQQPIHFVKYSEGGEYKLHHDGVDRCATALIYLNDGFIGGETEFPVISRVIKPEIGKLIIWDNITKDGEYDPESQHAGLPVEAGTKYIAVIWIKTKP